jgi:isoleucyl-tRNA synthetase
VRRAFDDHGSFTLTVDGTEVTLAPEEVEIRAEEHEDLTLAQDGGYAVALDLTLDEELRAEGLARELVRAVNDMRKANGYALTDRINVHLEADDPVAAAAKTHQEWIAAEVLATSFEIVPGPPTGTRVKISEYEVGLTLSLA